MAKPGVYEGTREEVAAHAEEFRAYPKLRLIVPAPAEEETGSRYRADLTPQERIRMLDELAERNKNIPPLPPEAFDRESLYEEK